jgi:hypothetical protein
MFILVLRIAPCTGSPRISCALTISPGLLSSFRDIRGHVLIAHWLGSYDYGLYGFQNKDPLDKLQRILVAYAKSLSFFDEHGEG